MTARYAPVSPLPDALRNWTGKPLNILPVDMAPCGYLPGCDGENRLLADIFSRLCALDSMTARLAFLVTSIMVHERRIEMAWDAAKGHGDTSTASARADRSAMVRLRPYEAMVDVLKLWLDELHEAAAAEIGVRFIDEAARIAS